MIDIIRTRLAKKYTMRAKSPTTPFSDHCPSCGAPVVGGRDACQTLFDTFAAEAYSDLRLAALRDLAFDAYCIQHPETYCRSAKSYAAHLTRLCCGMEFGGNMVVYAAIQKWLNGVVAIEKPAVLDHRGHLTILDVSLAITPEEKAMRVKAWAECVWEACTEQHELARHWIRQLIE
jgi:hypothetical protein